MDVTPHSHPAHRHHRHHPVLRALRLLVRSLPLLAGAVLLVLLYVALVGIPAPVVEALLRRLEREQGIHLEAGRVRLHPLRGISVNQLRYHGRERRASPLLEVRRVTFLLSPRDLLRRRPVLQGVRLDQATLRVEPARPAFGPATEPPVLLRDASASLLIDPRGWLDVTELDATLINLRLHGGGRILTGRDPDAPPVLAPARGPGRFLQALEQPPPWFGRLAEQLERIELEGDPELEVAFHLVPANWRQSTLRATGSGGVSTMRGIRLDQWKLDGEWSDDRIAVHQFAVQEGDHRFDFQGGYDLDAQTVEGAVTSSLPASHWLSLMPIAWRDRLREDGFFLEGVIGCHARFGPSPPLQFLESCAGTLSVHRAEARGVWIEEAHLVFDRQGDALRLDDIEARVGPSAQQGAVRGRLEYDLGTGFYAGQADTHVDFHALLPILSEDMENLVRNASFPNDPSSASVRFRRTSKEPGGFSMDGTLRATNFLWRGSFVNQLDTGLIYTNRTTHLDPFLALREEGSVEGSIRVNGAEKRVDLDLLSSIDAYAAGRGAGRTLERILDVFRFEGPTTARVDGVVYWAPGGNTRLTAEVTARKAGYKALLADQVDFSVLVSNRHVAVRDIDARLYDGTLRGWFDTFPAPDESDRAYRLHFEAGDVNFRKLVSAYRQEEGERQRGRLSGQLDLEGYLNPHRLDVAAGGGRVRIRDGMLLRVRLFGGLSRQLNRVVSGLGMTTQTDFTSDFTVAHRAIYTDNAVINGALISLTAAGRYGFDQSLDFDVRVRLLRDRSGISRVIQFVTTPLFWLFEFDLEGTLDEPVWSPRTLPRDLFGERDSADE